MPHQPGMPQVHLDVPLTNFALQYSHPEYLGYSVAPAVTVVHESDQYYIFNEAREDIVRPNALRAIGDKSNEIKFRVTTDTYSCEEYALRYPLADRIRDNADDVMRLRQRGTQQCLDQLMLDKELRLQGLFQTTGGAVPNSTVGTKWDDTGADPEADIQAAKSVVRRAIGKEPNSILMSRPVADALVIHLKGSLTALNMATKLTFMDLPDILWGLRVFIGDGIYRTDNPGQAAPGTISDIWNDNVVVFYMDPSPGIDVMTFVNTMQKRPFTTKTWRDEARAIENIECSHVEVEKLVAPIAALILDDALL